MRQQKQPRNGPKKNKNHSICGQPWSAHTIVVGHIKGSVKPVWRCPGDDDATPHDRKAY